MDKKLTIDNSWTLFLDRDGVINHKLEGDYVKSISEFKFLPGVLETMRTFSSIFQYILIVTNQQGIGKGLMRHEDLSNVHDYMESKVNAAGGRIDKFYYCPELAEANAPCRKPNTGMPEEAQLDFPSIDFSKSIMVGDSHSDIAMGNKLNMKTVYVSPNGAQSEPKADFVVSALSEISRLLDF